MPTTTVKEVTGPEKPRKIEWRRSIFFSDLGIYCRHPVRLGGVRRQFSVVCLLLSLATLCSVRAQITSARITVVSTAPARVRIDAQLANARAVSFRNTYAGILGLAERIQVVEGFRGDGDSVQIQKLAAGEFRAAESLSRLRYEINLAPPSRPSQMSHVSWLNADQGLLFMADLLPQPTDADSFSAVIVNIEVPPGWTVASNVKANGAQFSTDDLETAVFLIGHTLQEKRRQVGAIGLSVIMSGPWPVSDSDLIKTGTDILQHYSRVTGFNLRKDAMLMLVPYAGETGPENWTAETRGNVVVLLLGNKSNRKKILSRLGIVLSHEMFHLWVPNSLNLSGDYDWFFEGFTLYEALRTDLRLGLISFADYLDTLARVYDSYLSSADSRLSLIEGSERRWTTQSSLVYSKGMLAAFIYDLSVRKVTDCKASLDDVYAELFRLPARGQRSANETIIRVLTAREELKTFARDYVETASMINLETVLPAYGIAVQPGTSGATELSVLRGLNKSQNKLLRCLGYKK